MSSKINIKKEYDVIVVGGGPAGMMAAGRAGERGKKVLLLEKNRKLGEKLRITGGSRCNITNAESDTRLFLQRYGKAEQFLYSPFSFFGAQDTFSFFESHNLPLKVEAGKRAFPITEKAIDVEKVMEDFCRNNNVEIINNSPVDKIIRKDGIVLGVVSNGITYNSKNIILATGGMSHPETGSTGDGFSWLKDLGHTVADPTPSIVPIAVSDSWVRSLAGNTLFDMKINFFVEGKKKISKKGNVLFTHFGLSGPLILNAAKDIGDLLHQGTVTGAIDMYPAKELTVLEKEILSFFDNNKNKIFKNVCKEFLPPGMSKAIVSLFDVSIQDKKVHSITRDERLTIARTIKALPFTVKGLMGYDRAVVADGGVLIDEIDFRTMQSKKYPNLYLTGDLLNINRPTGGFSLQLCWTTGYVAGENV